MQPLASDLRLSITQDAYQQREVSSWVDRLGMQRKCSQKAHSCLACVTCCLLDSSCLVS